MLCTMLFCLPLLLVLTNGVCSVGAIAQTLPFSHGGKTVILAIDGGGLRGIVSATVLKRVEESIQKQTENNDRVIGDSFDVLAGTSTGGILAAYFSLFNKKGVLTKDGHHERPENSLISSLNLDGSAESAVRMYQNRSKEIFGRPFGNPGIFGIIWRSIRKRSRHSSSEKLGLDHVLLQTMRDINFEDVASKPSTTAHNPSLFLVAYDVTFRRPVAFVADRLRKKAQFLRLEPFAPPFALSFKTSEEHKPAAHLPGDSTRRHRISSRWIEEFQKLGGKFFDSKEKTAGFRYGPLNNLGDAQTLRNDHVKKWLNHAIGAMESSDITDEEKKANLFVFGEAGMEKLPVWKAARASSSAPTFLPPMRIKNFYNRSYYIEEYNKNFTGPVFADGFFCDGGIVANNPGLQALLYVMAHNEEVLAAAAAENATSAENPSRWKPLPDPDDLSFNKATVSKGEHLASNSLHNYALLSVGSGSSLGNVLVDEDPSWDDENSGSEAWWLQSGQNAGNLVSLLMDNSETIAHTNLQTLFTLAGCRNGYLRVQYRCEKDRQIIPENLATSLQKMDDTSPEVIEVYKNIGDYLAIAYGGLIDQFVFLHVLTNDERKAFMERNPALAELAYNGASITNQTKLSS